MLSYADVAIAGEDSDIFTDSTKGDLIVFTETPSQHIRLGTTTDATSMVAISNSNVDITGSLTVMGGLITSTGYTVDLDASIWKVNTNNPSMKYIGTSNDGIAYGISMSNPESTLDVGGNIHAYGNITSASDVRTKENVQVIEDALQKTLSIKGYTFERKGDTKRSAGVIAQEVHNILPEVVQVDSHGMMSVAYGNLCALLIQCVHELNSKVDRLEQVVQQYG